MKILPEYLAQNLALRLQKIYKENFSESFLNRILRLLLDNAEDSRSSGEKWSENDVVLITYGNSIVKKGEYPLTTLHQFLKTNLKDEISCVHILPFYPYSSDDGFSVIDYYSVNHDLGDWNHISKIGKDFSLMFDLVINHASQHSNWFQNFLNDEDPGNNFFITLPPETDLTKVVRPRSSPVLTGFDTKSGKKFVWTTFSSDQIDLNFQNPEVLIEMLKVFLFYLKKGVRIIRLDAIAFLWKSPGTTCLHLPETHEIVKLFREIAYYINPDVILLTETNVPNAENTSYFGSGDEAHMVYQFGLPPLLLHALQNGNSKYLTNWAFTVQETRKGNTYFNFTASHDGIGVRPLEGILPADELNVLLKHMEKIGGIISYKSNGNRTKSPYEINITYFDSLKEILTGKDDFADERFICSQTIMLAFKGIPAFYIHSLLATPNDYEGVEKTGIARSINRKVLNGDDVKQTLEGNSEKAKIFIELCRLIGIRKKQKAFHPDAAMKVMDIGSSFFCFIRSSEDQRIIAISNITNMKQQVKNVFPSEKSLVMTDIINNKETDTEDLYFNPYQTMWLLQK